LPLPDAPEVMVIQAAFLTAVHAQPGAAVTLTFPIAAAEPAAKLAELRV